MRRADTNHARCPHCERPIHPSRSRCEFCHGPEDNASENHSSTEEWAFSRVVFAVVEAASKYEAIAKGTAAFNRLVDNEDDPIDSVQLVDEFETEPAPFLIRRWSELPPAATASSESGQRLLNQAQVRATNAEDGTKEGANTFLYDETGAPIPLTDESQSVLQQESADVWLIPAIALTRAVDTETDQSELIETPNKKRLNCRECGHVTQHRFLEYETTQSDILCDQPIWNCVVCETPRYGPPREANRLD